jgi:hypothetical protein
VSKVEYYNGGLLLATRSSATAPTYSFSWTNMSAGTYSLTAKVYDSLGATAVSAPVTVTVFAPATMLSPVNGTKLTGASQAFTWSNAGASAYQIWVGTTLGGKDITVVNATATSATATGLPTNGTTIYVRLYSKFGTTWLFNDYTYTAAGTLGPATMISPVNASTLAGASQAFTWSNAGASAYQIWVGTTLGGKNITVVNSTSTTATATGLPTNGSTIYVRLYSKLGTSWLFNDYTYTASGSPAPPTAAAITSPVDGSVLTGASQTLTWNNVVADTYQVWVGTTLGANNLNVVNSTATTATVTGFPANGTTVYVRLYSKFGTTWLFSDSTYTSNP